MTDKTETHEQLAIDTLVELAKHDDPGVKLQAAQLILDHTRQIAQVNNLADEQRANRAVRD